MSEFFGAILMVLGILIATLSGLCGAAALVADHSSSDAQSGALVICGIPFVFGLGLFFGGLDMMRGPREPRK